MMAPRSRPVREQTVFVGKNGSRRIWKRPDNKSKSWPRRPRLMNQPDQGRRATEPLESGNNGWNKRSRSWRKFVKTKAVPRSKSQPVPV